MSRFIFQYLGAFRIGFQQGFDGEISKLDGWLPVSDPSEKGQFFMIPNGPLLLEAENNGSEEADLRIINSDDISDVASVLYSGGQHGGDQVLTLQSDEKLKKVLTLPGRYIGVRSDWMSIKLTALGLIERGPSTIAVGDLHIIMGG